MKNKLQSLHSWLTDQYNDDADRDDMSKDDWIRAQLSWLLESEENFTSVIQ